ncbi:MAG TPA: VOC family protein [Puia sp.]|nr:VOC family protein [Puia sp.]
MAAVNAYLNFQGNTEEAFNFYKSVFGGEFVTLQRFKDTPHGDQMSAEDREKIMHVALPIGQNTLLMGTDTLESMGQSVTFGDNIQLAVAPDSEADADRIFNGLSTGGTVTMPMEKAFWGAYFGMLKDKFGILWMVNYDLTRS